MGWEKVKGQDRAVSLLRRALESGRLPHAYLFLGPEGVGKKLAALTLAQALNCTEGGADFCGRCSGCHKVENGLHPDVVLLQPQESANIKIEQVRRLQEEIAYKPFEGRYKIWIIDQADKLTLQAANCLLKTLEEPPPHSLLILISSQVSALLPTVVSRCQQVRFTRLPDVVVKELLSAQGLGAGEIELGMALADGGASKISREQLEEFRRQREELLDYLQGQNNGFSAALALGEELGKEKDKIEGLVRLSNLWYRDLLLLKLGLSDDLLINRDKLPRLKQQVEGLELACIQQRLDALQEAFSMLQYNASPRLVLENTLLELKPDF